MVNDIIDIVEKEFGFLKYPFDGNTFIMTDGVFLRIPNGQEHSIVEKYLIDNDMSDYYYVKKAGSPTLSDLGCIRCSTISKQLYLNPKKPNTTQYESLQDWLEVADELDIGKVEICSPEGARARWFFDEMEISTMIEKIQEYYVFHQLYGAGTKR